MPETSYAKDFYTDPSITDEELTPEVLEEIGKCKHNIIAAVIPHWKAVTGYGENSSWGEILAVELEPCTPDFVRALAKAVEVAKA